MYLHITAQSGPTICMYIDVVVVIGHQVQQSGLQSCLWSAEQGKK